MIKAVLKKILDLDERTTRLTSTDKLVVHADGDEDAQSIAPSLVVPLASITSSLLADDSVDSQNLITGAGAQIAWGYTAGQISLTTAFSGATLRSDSISVASDETPCRLVCIGFAALTGNTSSSSSPSYLQMELRTGGTQRAVAYSSFVNTIRHTTFGTYRYTLDMGNTVMCAGVHVASSSGTVSVDTRALRSGYSTATAEHRGLIVIKFPKSGAA